MTPTGPQLDNLETALKRNLGAAVRALVPVLLLEKTRETRRRHQYSDQCANDSHHTCRRTCNAECDCSCHEPWEGYSPTLPDNYQGIRHHPVGKTWHDHDATSDRALQHRASREWLERFSKVQDDLAWLAQHALELVGEPVDVCPCGRPIADTDRRKTAQGKEWHASCYQRNYRGQPLKSET